MERLDRILLFSGGVDSVVAYYYLNKPNLLYINTNCKYSKQEYDSAYNFFEKEMKNNFVSVSYYSLDLSQFEQPDANIPARNALLLTIGSQYADTVYLVVQRGEDSGPDRCGSFFKRMSQMLTDCHQRKIVCDSVFPGKTKCDMVEFYMNSVGNAQYLLDAYSCYSGQEQPCSTCPACFRKFIALEYNGVTTAEYFNIPKLLKSHTTHEYLRKMKSHDNPYDRKRTKQTLKVLKWFEVE